MITGAHVVIYSKNPEADRVFFRDVLGFPHVDAGQGWLIFAMPPLEAAFHGSSSNGPHELFLMCTNLAETVADLRSRNAVITDEIEQRWGKLVSIELPGGGKLGLYQPSHPSPLNPAA